MILVWIKGPLSVRLNSIRSD